jgi:hypothetical protein
MRIKNGKHAERLIFMLEGMIDNYIDDGNEDCPNAEDCRGAIQILRWIPKSATAVTTIVPSSMEKQMLEIAQEQVDEYYGQEATRSTNKGDTPPSKQGE